MRLAIYGDRVMGDVQKEFASEYPFLKIEFFSQRGNKNAHYTIKRQFPHHLKLKEALTWKRIEGVLEISDTTTVADLENTFIADYGLPVELFRRSGNIWLSITITDNWTLKQQNEHGQEITQERKPAQNEPENDYVLDRDADR